MPKNTLPMVRIHNIETNEVIDREMTQEEFAEAQANQAIEDAKIAQVEAKATARTEILNRLGLTADEAAILLG
jgi:hypothetical protein